MNAVEQDMNSSSFFNSGAFSPLAALSLSFQIPAAKLFLAAAIAHEKSSGCNAPLSLNRRYSFSYSYQRPSSKQGVSDDRTSMSSESFDRRYAKLKSMEAAYRQYNLWWSALEDSGQAGSSSRIFCPPAYQLSPATDVDEPISVDRYVGGPAAKGEFVGRYPASTGSEIAVSHTCGATGSACRFQIPLAKDVSSTYGGESVYIYGVSSLRLSNNLLANGGQFRIPAPVTIKP